MLTDVKIKAAKPGKNPRPDSPQDVNYKMADSRGLYLLVTTQGGKWWRYKYRILVGTKRVERMGSLGTYPDVSLAEARESHAVVLKQLRSGDDPIEIKRKEKVAKGAEREKNRPFGEIAQEWFDRLIRPRYTAENTLRRYQYNVKALTKGIGNVPIANVQKEHLIKALLNFENQRKHETRRRLQVDALSIMEMAHDLDYIKVNPVAGMTFRKGYIKPSAVHKPRPAIVDAAGFGRLLRDLDKMPARTGSALRLLALTILRPGELLQAEWKNIDWKKQKMVVPFEILKMRTKRKGKAGDGRVLEVPLSRQALAELQALYKLTGKGRYLLPAQSSGSKVQHMRGYILNRALDRADYQGLHCPHGFRSSASTLLNAERRTIGEEEVLRWPDQKALIELQLDHNDASTQAIYDRGGRWKERCELMQLWADRIDEMRGHDRPRLTLVA